MKAIATLTLGATAFVGAFATGALAEDAKDTEFRESSRNVVVTDELFGDDGERGFRLVVDEIAPKDTTELTAPPAPPAPNSAVPAAPSRSAVRMVIDTPSPDDLHEPGVCVFVPAGNEAGGALSCPGGNVRIFEFGSDHGREFVIGDQAMNEAEIRSLVEARIAEVNARLAENGDWNIEVVEGFDSEQFQQGMEVLAQQMEELQREMEMAYQEFNPSNSDEMAEFQIYIQDFQSEMQDLAREMSDLNFDLRFDFLEDWVDEFNDRRELQLERAELARELTERRRELQFERRNLDLDEEDRVELAAELRELEQEMAALDAEMSAFDATRTLHPAAPRAPQHGDNMRWFAETSSVDRQVIRVERDGEQHITIIENNTGSDGNPRVVIHTTDPEWIDVVHIDADEYDE